MTVMYSPVGGGGRLHRMEPTGVVDAISSGGPRRSQRIEVDRRVIVVEQVAHQLVAQRRTAAAEDHADQAVTALGRGTDEAEAGTAG